MNKSLNLKRLLYFLLIFSSTAFGQKNNTTGYLNSLWNLPLPDSSKNLSTIFILNEQPKILSVFKPSSHSNFKLAAIAHSTLKKGEILVFGSSEYFKKPMLNQRKVSDLFLNILSSKTSNLKGKPLVAIYGRDNEDLRQFLKNKACCYSIDKNRILKKTAIIFLTQDITDANELEKLEKHIESGGMLVFGSPYGNVSSDSEGNVDNSGYLNINSLLVKSGLFNARNRLFSGRQIAKALSTNIPNYLYPDSMFKLLKTEFQDTVDYYYQPFVIDPTIKLIFENNATNSKILEAVRKDFKYADSILLPSKTHPVKINTKERRWGYIFNGLLAKRSFLNNPSATAKNYTNFPGTANKGNGIAIKEALTIPVHVGSQGLAEPKEPYFRPHSTGLYIPAGKKVFVSLDGSYFKQKLKAQIGVHSDDVTHLDSVTRDGFDLTETFELNKGTTLIYSPYGGLLLICIPDTSELSYIKISVEGAIKAPVFELNKTTNDQWRKEIRNYPAPWAELKTENIVFTVPSSKIRKLENPEELLKFWDKVMDADAELAAISRKRKHPERIIVDSDVAFGYMFTTRKKIVVPDDESLDAMLNKDLLLKEGSWGHFHEIGHRHQFQDLDFSGLTEVSVNLFTLYSYNQVLGRGLFENEQFKNRETFYNNIDMYFKDSPSYAKWKHSPFIALSMYVQIIDNFGWEPVKEVYKQFRSLPKDRYPKSNEEKIDLWFNSISKATNANLTNLFEVWQIPVSESAKGKVKGLKTWIPDYMLKYKK